MKLRTHWALAGFLVVGIAGHLGVIGMTVALLFGAVALWKIST